MRRSPRRAATEVMEFRRITSLPPYVFTIIDGLKIEARRAGERRDRPRLRQPRPAVARRWPSTSWSRQPTTPATTATRPAGASRSCARRVADLYLRRFGVDARSRDRGHQHDRRQGGVLAPDVGAAPARATRRWCRRRRIPIHICGPLFAGADVREVPLGHRQGLLRERPRGLRVLVAQAAGHRDVASRTTRRPHASTSSSCSGSSTSHARTRSWSSTTTRTPSWVRRVSAAVDPAGRRREGVRGRAVLDDQVVLDGRLAVGVPGRQRRGGAGAGEAQELPRSGS